MPKYACFTIDYELDYGGRIQAFDTLKQEEAHEEFRNFLKQKDIPLSAFVQTGALEKFPKAIEVIRSLATDFHSHSHSHASEGFESRRELEHSRAFIEDHFGQKDIGYRAPFGKLYEGDQDLLQELGFSFDSSVFPSFRPGKFNNLRSTTEPEVLANGLLEIPFAVIPKVRLILGISYMKLLGFSLYKKMMSVFGLPDVVVFYGHMHDYFPTERVSELPRGVRFAFNRNKHRALEFTASFFDYLKEQGYCFLSMSELAEKLKDK